MKDSDRYLKLVEWSDEDQCYIGSSPGLMHGGCHGDDERAVYTELCEIVEEIVELIKADGDPLPPATAGNGRAAELLTDNLRLQAAE
jgi:predicted RNase H-like HicB family nuclease